MALTVPVQTQPTVSLNAPTSARYSTPNLDDSASRRLQQTGQDVTRLGAWAVGVETAELEELNKARVRVALADFDNYLTDQTMGEQNGFMRLNGENALVDADGKPVAADYKQRVQTRYQDALKGLSNEAQRELFSVEAMGRMANFDRSFTRHQMQEKEKFQLGSYNAAIEAARNSASAQWGDAETVQANAGTITNTVDQIGELLGWDSTMKQNEAVKQLSPMYYDIIAQAVDAQSVETARDYYNNVKDSMNSRDKTRALSLIENADFTAQAQTKTEAIIQASDTMDDALASARSSLSGKLEDEVIRRIKQRYAETDATLKAKEAENENQAYWIVNNGGTWDSIPQTIKDGMSQKSANAIRRMFEAGARGEVVQTDMNVRQALIDKLSDNPDEFMKEDLMRYADKLDKETLSWLTKQQQGMWAGNAKAKEQQKNIQTATAQINTFANKVYPNAPKGQKREEKNAFIQEAMVRIQQAMRDAEAQGKQITQEERQKILDEMMLDVDTSWFWGGVMPRWKAQSRGENADDVQFTPQQRRWIQQELGATYTDEEANAALRNYYGLTDAGF